MTVFKPCLILPVYNHPHYLLRLAEHIQQYDCTIIFIDDGSHAECKAILQQIQNQYPETIVLQHQHNQGKGQAVMTGLDYAYQHGFSHALQLDVDGQHDWQDIDKFLKSAQQHPQAMIIGNPIYADDVPKSRLYGRYATHIWVWINSLSFAIKDSMCGFRVYPVPASWRIMQKYTLRKRMGFDSEILVYLRWQGIDFINIPTKVIYPEDGISHFRLWEDNVELSKMHAQLFFGMLWRLPYLLWKKIAKGSSS